MRLQRIIRQLVCAVLVVLVMSGITAAQIETADTGLSPNSPYSATDIDAVNLSNGNLFVKIPLWNIPQRGDLSLPINLIFNSPSFGISRWCDFSSGACYDYLMEESSFGVGVDAGSVPTVFSTNYPYDSGDGSVFEVEYISDATGHMHPLAWIASGGSEKRAIDGSGYLFQHLTGDLVDPRGTIFRSTSGEVVDRNGNRMSYQRIPRPEDFFRLREGGAFNASPNRADGSPNIVDTYATVSDSVGRQFTFVQSTSQNGQITSDYWGVPASSSACVGPRATAYARQLTFPGPQGQSANFTLCYANVAIKTNCTDLINPLYLLQYNKTVPLLQAVILPNGKAWIFEYDWHNPGDSSDINYGLLSRIVTPAGASISYSYVTYRGKAMVVSKTVDANDGSPAANWTYDYAQVEWGPPFGSTVETLPSVPVLKPSPSLRRDQIQHTFGAGCDTAPESESETMYFQGSVQSGRLLKTVHRDFECYSYWESPMPFSIGGALPARITTTWDDGSVAKVETDYTHFTFNNSVGQPSSTSSYGTVQQLREFDFGQTVPTKTTTYSYYGLAVDGAYLTANLVQLPYEISVQGDGVSRTDRYEYDQSTLQASNVPSPYLVSPASVRRGNLTTKTECVGCTAAPISHLTYFDTGLLQASEDPMHHTTTYAYSTQGTFLSDSWDQLHHHVGFARDANTGDITSKTDENSQPTQYSYDNLRRLLSVEAPDGGLTTYGYNDDIPQMTMTAQLSTSSSISTTVTFDKLGREIRTAVSGGSTIETEYDGPGRVSCKTNPYLTTQDTTYGKVCYERDVLGRVTAQSNPDNSSTTIDYSGSCSTRKDETLRTRKECTDSFNRIVTVTEPDSVTGALAQGLVTTYRYNALDNLTRVIQPGVQDRVFTYDNLSRIITAYNPESGQTCYGVWSGGNCVNGYDNTGNLLKKTDARGVTTTFAYDELNRLLSRQYSDGTPSACFQYDQGSNSGPNSVGRLVTEWTQAGSCSAQPPSNPITKRSILSYDRMGRNTQEEQCTPFNCNVSGRTPYSFTYGYDYLGNVNLFTNGIASISFTTSQDSANRLKTVKSSWIDETHPETLFSVTDTGYGPAGLIDAALGNGLALHREYDSRLRPTRETDTGYLVTPAAAGSGSLTISGTEQTTGTPTASTGSVTLAGSEQSKQQQTGTATTASGTVTVSGALQTRAATVSTGSVTISGAGQRQYICPSGLQSKQSVVRPDSCLGGYYVYNSGSVSITVGTLTKSTNYTYNNTSSGIANALASYFNGDVNSPVTAQQSGSTINFTSKATGSSTNYSLSTGCTYDSSNFSGCSFWGTRSGPTMTGGSNTIYDSGTTTITVNGQQTPYSWSGSTTTATSIAVGLAAAVNANSSYVTASASGSVVTLTTRLAGANVNYSLASSSTYDSSNFSGPSFSTSNSGSTLTGGKDATTTTVYDSGTAVLTVNGSNTSVSYGQGDTTSSIITKLANALGSCGGSGLVSGVASGATLNLTSCSKGSSVNYALSASTTYDTSNFSSRSFTATTSGGTMTGGSDSQGTVVYDSGTVTLTINGVDGSTSYGQGATASSVALGLSAAFASSSQVSVSATGTTLTITAKAGGATSNYSYSASSNYDTAHFGSPSFSAPSGTLTGGTDASTSQSTVYSYVVNAYEPNGNPSLVSDSMTGTWGYSYDPLNRLKQAASSSGTFSGVTIAWSYDARGNRLEQTPSGANSALVPASWAYFDASNRVTSTNIVPAGFLYDASGNVTNDGMNQYNYDAENRIASVQPLNLTGQPGPVSTQYVYDTEGHRVAKLNGSGAVMASYALDLGGEQVTETDGGGNWVHSNVFAGGKLLATYDNNGLHFHANDWLGTRRAQTKYDGTIEFGYQSLPFGDGLATLPYPASTADATEHHFTGKERDSETGLDYFGARYYGSTMGRFSSPDHPLIDQHPDNPQSWNLYAYVRNNPLMLLDPNGLGCVTDLGPGSDDAHEKVEINNSISSGDCANQHGTWVPGDINKENIGAYRSSDGGIMFQVTTNTGGNFYYSTFASGAHTDENGVGPGASIAHVPTNWLSSQLVGGSLNQLMSFAANRFDPRRDGALMALLAGPGLSFNARDNWAGPGGMGTPQGQGDWAAMVHDYNYFTNNITIWTYFNPFISRATARALIQSDNYLITHAGGVQGAKMGAFFGVVNAFQWLFHPSF